MRNYFALVENIYKITSYTNNIKIWFNIFDKFEPRFMKIEIRCVNDFFGKTLNFIEILA